MQSLPPALFLVMLELTIGAYVTLYLLDLRGGTSRGYIIFQGMLYLVFAALTYAALGAFASKDLLCHVGLCRQDLDATWLGWQQPLVIVFSLALALWNVLLWLDRSAPRQRRAREDATADVTGAAPARQPALGPAPRATAPGAGRGVIVARRVVGAGAALVGLLAIFVVGMAYRPLAAAHLNGAFVVGAFLAGSLALGGVTTAMLLGHWYLNTPSASGKPLEFTTTLLLAGLVAELLFSLALGPSTAHALPNTTTVAPGTTIQTTGHTVIVATPTAAPGQPPPATTPRVAPIDTTAMLVLQYAMGLLAPLALGAVALWLTRGRSFQSATGMLYLCMAFIFIGEILARGLLLLPVL
ncbi:MAG TPA: hypothetical protein VID73_09685 [Ktedonobacterales bacterium]|jgi:hypothetical protein